MKPELKEMIDNGEISELEILNFLKTIKKLSKNNILDNRNYKLVINHFGLKKKNGYIKFGKHTKYKLK